MLKAQIFGIHQYPLLSDTIRSSMTIVRFLVALDTSFKPIYIVGYSYNQLVPTALTETELRL